MALRPFVCVALWRAVMVRRRVGGAVRLVDGGRGEQCRSCHAWARTWPCGSPGAEAASGMRCAAVLSTSGTAGGAARGARGASACARGTAENGERRVGACAREGGDVARKPEAGRRGRVAFRSRGRREEKGGEGRRREEEGKGRIKEKGGKEKEKEKGRKRKGKEEMVEGKREREKGRKRG
jgi:hypothetical protein